MIRLLVTSLLFCLSLISWGQEHPTFVAKNGDTIYSILRENNLSPSKYVSEFKKLNAGKLSKNDGLLIGVKYLIPTDSAKKETATTAPAEKKTETTPSTSAVEYKTVVAKPGDGISIILEKNGLSPSKYTAEFIELNKKNIGKNNDLFAGTTYKLPVDTNTKSAAKVDSIPTPAEYKTFIAQRGDGISIVLSKYGLSPDKYTAEFIELNKENIGKNNDLFIGTEYKLPFSANTTVSASTSNNTATSTTTPAPTNTTSVASDTKSIKKLKNSLYGPTYQNFDQISTKLSGAIYYLISGHGGPDPGAHGTYENRSIYEDEYAYDVALRLSRELESHGATVYMIIRDKNDGIRDDVFLNADKDEYCYPNDAIPLNQVKRLNQRSEAVNELYKINKGSFQRCVITHIDSRAKNTPIDAFFYYDERSSGGEKLARILYDTFNDKYRNRSTPRDYYGTVSSRNLFVLRNTLPVATFIELGNINYYRDIQRIVLKDNRQALANWICEGLITDYQRNKANK